MEKRESFSSLKHTFPPPPPPPLLFFVVFVFVLFCFFFVLLFNLLAITRAEREEREASFWSL